MTHRLSAYVSAALAGVDLPDRYPYSQWEEAFIERWDMVPDPDVPNLARKYMHTYRILAGALTVVEAMRVFHVNQFKPTSPENLVRFLQDYNRVPLEIVEPAWENDPETGGRMLRYLEEHDPNSAARRGRKLFDMSPDREGIDRAGR